MAISELAGLVANFATVLGIPLAILVYLNEKRKERLEREYGTYNALDEKYIEYLQLCISNPRLDLYYLPLGESIELSPEERVQQYAMFEILVALMERAFLMYRDQSTKIKQSQWEGWNAYMHDWGKRENFRKLWKLLGHQFDEDFSSHMNSIMELYSKTEDL